MDGALAGGNMNAVVRDGDSVLRTAGPWTPTVHRYLDYLAVAGVDWAPRPLGIEGDRERLSFVEGDVPLYPLPDWVWADAVLDDGARRLRQLHDASVGFGLDGAVWQAPAKVPAEVICHIDFAPHNLAFADGAIVGAIDFDFCSTSPSSSARRPSSWAGPSWRGTPRVTSETPRSRGRFVRRPASSGFDSRQREFATSVTA